MQGIINWTFELEHKKKEGNRIKVYTDSNVHYKATKLPKYIKNILQIANLSVFIDAMFFQLQIKIYFLCFK